MTNGKHTDPDITGFVTKVMEMTPDAPPYPERVIARETAPKRLPSWAWAPIGAVAVLLVLVPIAMQGDSADVPELPFAASPPTADEDHAADNVINAPNVVPDVEAERNTLVFTPAVVAQGGELLVDFNGANNMPRSSLFWMDRFDYDEQQWFSEWILWSDRCDDCPSFAYAAAITVLAPEPDVVIDGTDRLTLPTDLPLGTYRVCVGAGDGGCGVFEISDEGSDLPREPTIISEDPLTEVPFQGAPGPEFGAVFATVGSDMIVVAPYEFLIGPDADLVAIADGFIGEGEELPNGFYIRPIPDGVQVELEPSDGFEALVVNPADSSAQITLDFAGWVDWYQTNGGPDDGQGMWMYLTYSQDGKISTLTEQYVP